MKLRENEQKEQWYIDTINPNGRIPAITDILEDGRQIRVFESGAVLEYLVDRYDRDHKVSYPRNSPEYWETLSWVRSFFVVTKSCSSTWLTWLILAHVADGRLRPNARAVGALQKLVLLGPF